MKGVAVKKSKKGRTLYVGMSIWKQKGKNVIKISIPEVKGFLTSVNNKSGERCHKNLYKKLKKLLVNRRYWHD